MQEKINYVSPECKIIEMRLKGVIFASGPQFEAPFDSEQPW